MSNGRPRSRTSSPSRRSEADETSTSKVPNLNPSGGGGAADNGVSAVRRLYYTRHANEMTSQPFSLQHFVE